MSTLKDALTATLSANAVEVSLVQVVAGIQMIENAYVSPRDDISHSTAEFLMPEPETPAQRTRAETIMHAGTLHTRTADGGWVPIPLPRPALGPLALLTFLYGADLEQPLVSGEDSLDVELSAAQAAEQVPDQLRNVLDDLLSATGPAQEGRFPANSTVRLRVHQSPLYIAEASITTTLDGGSLFSFALEVHPTSARVIDIPDSEVA